MEVALALLVWLTLIAVATGFQSTARVRVRFSRCIPCTSNSRPRTATSTKTHRGAAASNDATPSSSGQSPWVYDTSPKSAKEKASFRNQVPFKDDVYGTLKGSIELLTKRLAMNKDLSGVEISKLSIDERAAMALKSLTVDEAQWLVDAVEVIIDDAYRYGPPPRPVKSADSDAAT